MENELTSASEPIRFRADDVDDKSFSEGLAQFNSRGLGVTETPIKMNRQIAYMVINIVRDLETRTVDIPESQYDIYMQALGWISQQVRKRYSMFEMVGANI